MCGQWNHQVQSNMVLSSGPCLTARRWQYRSARLSCQSNLSEPHLLFTGVSLAPCHGAAGLNMSFVWTSLKLVSSWRAWHLTTARFYRVGCVFQLPSIGHSVVQTLSLKQLWKKHINKSKINIIGNRNLVSWVGGGQGKLFCVRPDDPMLDPETLCMEGLLVCYSSSMWLIISILKQIQGGYGGIIRHGFPPGASWQCICTFLTLWLSHVNNLWMTVLIFRKKHLFLWITL